MALVSRVGLNLWMERLGIRSGAKSCTKNSVSGSRVVNPTPYRTKRLLFKFLSSFPTVVQAMDRTNLQGGKRVRVVSGTWEG